MLRCLSHSHSRLRTASAPALGRSPPQQPLCPAACESAGTHAAVQHGRPLLGARLRRARHLLCCARHLLAAAARTLDASPPQPRTCAASSVAAAAPRCRLARHRETPRPRAAVQLLCGELGAAAPGAAARGVARQRHQPRAAARSRPCCAVLRGRACWLVGWGGRGLRGLAAGSQKSAAQEQQRSGQAAAGQCPAQKHGKRPRQRIILSVAQAVFFSLPDTRVSPADTKGVRRSFSATTASAAQTASGHLEQRSRQPGRQHRSRAAPLGAGHRQNGCCGSQAAGSPAARGQQVRGAFVACNWHGSRACSGFSRPCSAAAAAVAADLCLHCSLCCRVIYVRNLPFSISSEEVRQLLSAHQQQRSPQPPAPT